MADAWGGAWGASWGASWGSGATPQPEPDPGWLGGGGYVHPYIRHRAEEEQREKIQRQKAEIDRLDAEIAEADRKQREASEKRKAEARERREEARLVALKAQLSDEINRLRMERAWLMRQIDDEEAILVLLLSMPLH